MMRTLLLILTLPISSCSSYKNQNEGENYLGGGFRDAEIEEGLHYILARSNFGPWEKHEEAQKIFNRRAEDLCSGGFKVLRREEGSYEQNRPLGEIKYIVSEVGGFVLCDNSSLQVDEAKKRIEGIRGWVS